MDGYKMKTGITLPSYTMLYGFEQGLKRLKAHGYDCVDYQDFIDTNNSIFQLDEDDFKKELLKVKDAVTNAGLEISQSHGPWRWPIQDATPEDRAERFEKMAKAIRGTALLGCKNYVIHAIMPFGCASVEKADLMWDMNYEFMGRLCKIAEDNDVIICFENLPFPKLSLAYVTGVLKFVKNMALPNFKVCLDTGHCTITKESPADAVRLLGKEYLQTLHVHDNNGVNDCHWIPYTGVIDWGDFAKALQEINFEGTVSLETHVPFGIPRDIIELHEVALAKMTARLAGR